MRGQKLQTEYTEKDTEGHSWEKQNKLKGCLRQPLWGHSIIDKWGLESCWGVLETVAEEVAQDFWKLL